jgi:hypothetical protein
MAILQSPVTVVMWRIKVFEIELCGATYRKFIALTEIKSAILRSI